jgi:hypothetical protein
VARGSVLTLRLTGRIQLTAETFIFYPKAMEESFGGFGAGIYAQAI